MRHLFLKNKRIVFSLGIVTLLAALFSSKTVRLILFILLFTDWSETSLPKQEKFEREIVKIHGIKFWEMKNVYTTDEEASFFFIDEKEGECVFSRYYMVNKTAKDEETMRSILEEFCERTPFVPNVREAAVISEGKYKVILVYKFYKKSKDLPAFWRANMVVAAPDVIKWHDPLAEIIINEDESVPKKDVVHSGKITLRDLRLDDMCPEKRRCVKFYIIKNNHLSLENLHEQLSKFCHDYYEKQSEYAEIVFHFYRECEAMPWHWNDEGDFPDLETNSENEIGTYGVNKDEMDFFVRKRGKSLCSYGKILKEIKSLSDEN
ncbi:MAG: hypothetical protein K2N58_07610 [Treponemataceae bacterium]|nr:hypothetical protein [Treponemataceae bacterium]